MQLRYLGFDQANNIREYTFYNVAAGETATHFVVSADLALFLKYRVRLQEGPALCLKELSADLEALQPFPHELTSGDLAAQASAQAGAAERKTRSRKSRNSPRILTRRRAGNKYSVFYFVYAAVCNRFPKYPMLLFCPVRDMKSDEKSAAPCARDRVFSRARLCHKRGAQ